MNIKGDTVYSFSKRRKKRTTTTRAIAIAWGSFSLDVDTTTTTTFYGREEKGVLIWWALVKSSGVCAAYENGCVTRKKIGASGFLVECVSGKTV